MLIELHLFHSRRVQAYVLFIFITYKLLFMRNYVIMNVWLLVPPTRLIPHTYMVLFPIIVHWNNLAGFSGLLWSHFRFNLIVIHLYIHNRLRNRPRHFHTLRISSGLNSAGIFMKYNFGLSLINLFKTINIWFWWILEFLLFEFF